MEVLSFIKSMLDANPNLSPEEVAHNLHVAGYDVDTCVSNLKNFFSLNAEKMAQIIIDEFKHPLIGKEALIERMKAVGYLSAEVEEAVQKYYPTDTSRYAVKVSRNSIVTAPSISQYNLGTGDFTFEAWVCPKSGGTLISRKPTPGCSGNGGFLLVIKSNGVIKLATDDGYGFYEVNSEPVNNLFDGTYHHVLGLRKGTVLNIYVDFAEVKVTSRTDRHSGLNINNGIRLAVGFTDQIQEEYNHLEGKVGEIRLWSIAKTYANKSEWKETDYVEFNLIGMFPFDRKSGEDYSNSNNNMNIQNADFETWNL